MYYISRSATDAVSPAIELTKQRLFKPFRWGFWWRMALVALMTGELGSGNFNVPNLSDLRNDHPRKDELLYHAPWSNLDPATLKIVIAGIILALIAGTVLVFVLLYITSVFRFILFDSVLLGDCKIGDLWTRRQRAGRKFFKFNVILLFVTLSLMVILFGSPVLFAWAAGFFEHPSDHLKVLIPAGILLVLLFIAFAIASAVVSVFARDFLVPVLALEDISLGDAVQKVKSMVTGDKSGYAVYVVMRIILALAVAILFGILNLIVFFILLVPVIVVGIGIALLISKAGAAKLIGITLAIVLGVIAVAAIFFVTSLVALPGAIFQQSYSMYFFGSRYEPLMIYMYPMPPPSPPPIPAPA